MMAMAGRVIRATSAASVAAIFLAGDDVVPDVRADRIPWIEWIVVLV
jgi:hypothetical protein